MSSPLSDPDPPSTSEETSSENPPWYGDGLQFTCTGCGNCCTGEPGVVWIDDGDLQRIADHTGLTTGEVRLFHTKLYGGRLTLTEFANGDCTFFDGETRRCTIYPVRPIQCRTWPFWNSNLATEEAWQTIAKDCPGVNQGNFVPLEQIEHLRSQTDL